MEGDLSGTNEEGTGSEKELPARGITLVIGQAGAAQAGRCR
jgi:hypothetical protein